MSKYANKEEEFTAYLIGNPEIFKILYYCVVYAGKNTTDSVKNAPEMNSLTFLPIETKGTTRIIRPFFCNYKNIKLEYDWTDITIVGGSAISAIELITQKDTEDYLHVQTSDIDIVWWPRKLHGYEFLPIAAQKAPVYPATSEDGKTILLESYEQFLTSDQNTQLRKKEDYVITSLSPAIIHLTRTFAKNLDSMLKEFIIRDMDYVQTVYKICNAYYPVEPSTFLFNFSVEASCDTNLQESDSKEIAIQKSRILKSSILSGTWSVVVYMEFPKIPLRIKILDIAIHDECSSQKSDSLISSHDDPIYTSHSVPDSILEVEIPRSKFTLRLPTVKRLLEQQFLALQNRIRDYWEYKKGDMQKILTHHRRIQYLIDLLQEALYTGSNQYKHLLVNKLQLQSFPLEYYSTILKNVLISKDEWIASCPIYFPPLLPCSNDITDPEQVKLCSLQTCKIPLTDDSKLIKLCEENKVIQKELCTLLPKRSKKSSIRSTKKNNSKRLGQSSKSPLSNSGLG